MGSLSLLIGNLRNGPEQSRAPVLRGEANLGRRGPFWNIEAKGKGARQHRVQVQVDTTRTEARYVSFLHKTAQAIRTSLFASATIATFWWVRAIS
jgi:hypothetical protein